MPKLWVLRAFAAMSSRSVVSAPPSPAVIPFRPWKEKQAASPKLPAGRPWYDGPLGDGRLDRLRVDRPGVGEDVGEDRLAAAVDDRVSRGRERVVGDDDLVAGLQTECGDGQVQRGRAVVHGQCVAGARGPRERLTEPLAGRPLTGDPAGAEHLLDGADLRLAECRLPEGDDIGGGGWARHGAPDVRDRPAKVTARSRDYVFDTGR
jgi:hypothetical protein